MNPPPPDLPPPSAPASLPPPSLSSDPPPSVEKVREVAPPKEAAPAPAPVAPVEVKKEEKVEKAAPPAPEKKVTSPPAALNGLPAPSLSPNLPPPAEHVPEVVVSQISKPTPPKKKEEEAIPDRPVQGVMALFRDAKTWPWTAEQPKFMKMGLLLSLALGIAAHVPIAGVVVSVVVAVYLGDYFYRIIHNTLEGSDKLPDWPKLNEPVEDLIRPGTRIAVGFLVCHIALLFVYITSDTHVGMPTIPREISYLAAAIYFPIAALMIVFQERFAACAPWIVLPAFVRCLPGSLAAISFCIVAMLGGRALLLIPYVGHFGSAAFSLVIMVSLARFLGMLAAQNRHSLAELH